MNLNSAQSEAITALEGAHGVIATAGSGKTRVLVERYKRLLETTPETEVLSLTFTREAAQEMRKRAGVVPAKFWRPFGFLTLHSLALSFATIERDNFPFKLADFPLATAGQSNKFLSDSLQHAPGIDFQHAKAFASIAGRNGYKWFKDTQEQSQLISDVNLMAKCRIYGDYLNRCMNAGLMDFDSLLLVMNNMLCEDEKIWQRWQYEYIQTDESQDLDMVQFGLVKKLSERSGNVFSVGDANQSIYEWRGAATHLFLNFKDMFPDAKIHILGQNYRSTQKLVSFFEKIAPVKEGPLVEFSTTNEVGIDPIIKAFPTNQHEAQWISENLPINFVPYPLFQSPTAAKSKAESTAILARTNQQLRLFEDLFAQTGVKYHVLGKSGFWHQEEIKNVLSFIKLVTNRFTDHDIARCLKAPFQCSKFIRKQEVLKNANAEKGDNSLISVLRQYQDTAQQTEAVQRFVHFTDSLRRHNGHPVKDVVEGVLDDLKAYDYYDTEVLSTQDNAPADNLAELSKIAMRFKTLEEFLNYARKVGAASKSKKGIALSTIHQAKGKEWDAVYLAGCNDGLLPHKRGEVGEEARLFSWAVRGPLRG